MLPIVQLLFPQLWKLCKFIFLKLKFYGKNYYLKFLLNLFKNIYSTIQTENYVCIKNANNKKYKYFFISHVSKKDFLRNGSYFDKYFGLYSQDCQNTLFF